MKALYSLLVALSLTTVAATASAQTTNKIVRHTVKKGDTLSSIARKHHTTVAKVRQANGFKKGAIIRCGKVLKVPTTAYISHSNTMPKPRKYVINKGDTLSSIARKHHTSVTKIRKANALRKGEVLKIGKLLKIPQNTKTIRVAKTEKKVSDKKNGGISF